MTASLILKWSASSKSIGRLFQEWKSDFVLCRYTSRCRSRAFSLATWYSKSNFFIRSKLFSVSLQKFHLSKIPFKKNLRRWNACWKRPFVAILLDLTVKSSSHRWIRVSLKFCLTITTVPAGSRTLFVKEHSSNTVTTYSLYWFYILCIGNDSTHYM